MARPIKRNDRFAVQDEPATAAPVPFLPFNAADFYTDAELAAKFKVPPADLEKVASQRRRRTDSRV